MFCFFFLLFYSVKSSGMLFYTQRAALLVLRFYVKYVNNILEIPICAPLQPALPPLFLPFCRGEKVPSAAHFLSPESQFLLKIPWKTISFSLSLFRSYIAIFHNKDNISIFYKKLKICRINGYWTEYNILMFWFCLKMQ